MVINIYFDKELIFKPQLIFSESVIGFLLTTDIPNGMMCMKWHIRFLVFTLTLYFLNIFELEMRRAAWWTLPRSSSNRVNLRTRTLIYLILTRGNKLLDKFSWCVKVKNTAKIDRVFHINFDGVFSCISDSFWEVFWFLLMWVWRKMMPK